MNFEPGTLVQVKKGVYGRGNIGIVIGPVKEYPYLIEVLFHDGPHDCHPTNLQKPDGRTKQRG